MKPDGPIFVGEDAKVGGTYSGPVPRQIKNLGTLINVTGEDMGPAPTGWRVELEDGYPVYRRVEDA
jgi:hypothetical protein